MSHFTRIDSIENLQFPRRKKKRKKMRVQSYGALVVEVNQLKKEVSKQKLYNKWLMKETNIQAKVIGQLKYISKCC